MANPGDIKVRYKVIDYLNDDPTLRVRHEDVHLLGSFLVLEEGDGMWVQATGLVLPSGAHVSWGLIIDELERLGSLG